MRGREQRPGFDRLSSFKYSRVTVLIARWTTRVTLQADRLLVPSRRFRAGFIGRLLKIYVAQGTCRWMVALTETCSAWNVLSSMHGAPSTWLLHAPLIPFYFPTLVMDPGILTRLFLTGEDFIRASAISNYR